jgi:hypothetical protein
MTSIYGAAGARKPKTGRGDVELRRPLIALAAIPICAVLLTRQGAAFGFIGTVGLVVSAAYFVGWVGWHGAGGAKAMLGPGWALALCIGCITPLAPVAFVILALFAVCEVTAPKITPGETKIPDQDQ